MLAADASILTTTKSKIKTRVVLGPGLDSKNIEFDISLETDAESFPVKTLKLDIMLPRLVSISDF